jgi:hypothetical protein
LPISALITEPLAVAAAKSNSVPFIQAVTILIAVCALVLTIVQIRKDTRSALQARQADVAWSMYLTYAEGTIRAARGNVETLAHKADCPTTAQEYKDRIADDQPWQHYNDDTADMHMRRLLRFYNQVAVLVQQKLIDVDFVFHLIGSGLDTCWPALVPAIQYYQNFYAGLSGTEMAQQPRPIYNEIMNLHNRFTRWSSNQRVQPC